MKVRTCAAAIIALAMVSGVARASGNKPYSYSFDCRPQSTATGQFETCNLTINRLTNHTLWVNGAFYTVIDPGTKNERTVTRLDYVPTDLNLKAVSPDKMSAKTSFPVKGQPFDILMNPNDRRSQSFFIKLRPYAVEQYSIKLQLFSQDPNNPDQLNLSRLESRTVKIKS